MADLRKLRNLGIDDTASSINNDSSSSSEDQQISDLDMAPPQQAPIHRSSSRPQLDLSGAAIQGNFEERDPTILLPNQSDDISHLALDIGGSLIKLVYFSRHEDRAITDKRKRSLKERLGVSNGNRRSCPILGGRLHFVKFETRKINECLDFIYSKQLHRGGIDPRGWSPDTQVNENAIIKATGGGAYKFADMFKERLGVSIEKEDEMNCLVAGANFLLKAIRHEAFTHMEGQKKFVQIDQNDLFPYLLVNIGSGVSIIKVDGEGKYERVSGTNVGGGTYWGLGRLLTKCKSFDELLELSQRGDNKEVDMLVGDIYGGLDYSKIGLSASTIASSFGKAVSENKELEDYRPEDISLSLLRMISYNIGQIAYLNALRFGLKRIFFGGFFIRGHAYTMDTISFAVHFWSKGEAKAMFLRHEGFLGALGAFMSYEKHGLDDLMAHQFVERFPMGAPCVGGKIHGPPLGDLSDKLTSNVMLRLVWLFLHLAATIVHFTLATTYTLQCYIISTGLLNKYKALDLTKLQCLAIVIESQEAYDTSRVVTLLRWLSDVGVKYICLYDMDGVLKRSKYTILEDLGDKWHLEGDEKGSSLDQTHTSLEFISFSDGKEGIAKAAGFLYTNYKEISDIGEQDKAIVTEADMAKALTAVGCGGPQPNLLLVYGPVRCHLGFPAWRLKYTEIVHMGTLKSMKHGAVLKTVHQFTKVQQNFGT